MHCDTWQVSLEEVDATAGSEAPFHVASVLYTASHRVSAERLRPLWIWDGPIESSAPTGTGRSSATGRATTSGSTGEASSSDGVMGDARWRYELIAGTGLCDGDDAAACLFTFVDGIPRRHSLYFHKHLKPRAAS